MFSRIHTLVRGSMASKKRKCACISLETKLKVIDEISKGQLQRHASEVFGIPKSTVPDVWKHRDKIKDHVFAAEAPEEYAKKRTIIRDRFSHVLNLSSTFRNCCGSCFALLRKRSTRVYTHLPIVMTLSTRQN